MEFSKIATDMNTKIENDEQMTVDVELESGETITCAIIIVLTVNSKDYIVLLPLDKNENTIYLGKDLNEKYEKDTLKEVYNLLKNFNFDLKNIIIDFTLARGLGYYTGTIFEIAIPEFGGSCGGGGRYDKMIGNFTGQNTPACGFSIGFERIILLLMEQGFKVPGASKKVASLSIKQSFWRALDDAN